MIFDLIERNLQLLSAVSAAISVAAAVILVSWPYLVRDQLSARMALVANEREQIRLRERKRLNEQKGKISLQSEPRQLFQEIVDRFNLAKQAEDGELVLMLRRAGYRGRAPMMTFLAARLISPVGMFIVSTIYVFWVGALHQPTPIKFAVALVAGSIGYYVPTLYLKNRIAKRQTSIRRAWPDALDLLLICVECGMGIDSCIRKVSEEIGLQSPELAEEFALMSAELSYLQDRRKAYENLGERTGLESVKAVATSLVQSEKYGTGLGQALRVLSDESRSARLAEAEKKASALPPKLTVPMIVFFLPILFVVILAPALISFFGLH